MKYINHYNNIKFNYSQLMRNATRKVGDSKPDMPRKESDAIPMTSIGEMRIYHDLCKLLIWLMALNNF